MSRGKLPFLTIFFALLGISVVAAIALRVRSHSDDAPAAAQPAATDAGSAGAMAEAASVAGTQAQDTATIVETQTAAAEKQRASASSMDAIEQERRRIFEKLLGDRPAVTRQAPPVETASAGSAVPPQQVTQQRRDAAPRPVSQPGAAAAPQPVAQQPKPPSTETPSTNAPRQEEDPDSDTQPPQMVAMQFEPVQVQDGGSTVLTVLAQDNMTGVRSISGTIVSPAKGMQGFALQREGDTNRFSTRINIPEAAPEGMWAINYISLTDNASNSTSVTYAPPNVPPAATFRVISDRPDSTGPMLKAVWLDRPSIKAGEKNTIFMQVDDDKSGVNTVSGVFVSPQKHARIGFSCNQAGADTLNWTCTFSAPPCLDCGNWQLEQVQMQDKARNMSAVRNNDPVVGSVRMDIFGNDCDSRPPAMSSMTIDRNVVSNAEAASILMTVQASDDLCGVASISGHATAPQRPGSVARVYFSLTSKDGQTWTGPINIPKSAPTGQWTITWTQILDKGFNLKPYAQGDPALAGGSFRVD